MTRSTTVPEVLNLKNHFDIEQPMTWPGRDDIHVSRDALSVFAWSAPMRDLAAKVGISDVGLKKLLRSHGIVTPPQGYWNKVHAGKRVPDRPKSPPRRPGETGRITLDGRFRGLIGETPSISVDGPFASAAVPEQLEELRDRELKAIGRVPVPRNLDKPHAGLAQLLKREDQKRQKALADRWYWNKPAFDTPLGQRKLKILNGLFHAVGRRGHSGEVWEDRGELSVRCRIGDMTLGLSFTIVGKHRTEVIAGYHRPAPDLPGSTPLCLSLDRHLRANVKTTWQDDALGKLETRLAAIAADIIVAGEAAFRQGLIEAVEWEEKQRQWAEERRRQRIAELQAKRLEDLRASGKLLAEADEIRSLAARVKEAVIAGRADISVEELGKWERWALDYADRLDPVLSGHVLSHVRVHELDELQDR